MYLELDCQKCRISSKCPKFGSSPLVIDGKQILCRLVGGYGRVPIDETILSEESLEKFKKDGPCLTIAEIPSFENGIVAFTVEKIFSDPVLNERETTNEQLDRLYPKSHG